MADKRSNNVVAIVAIIVIVLVAGVLLYYVLGGNHASIPVGQERVSETIIEVETPEEIKPNQTQEDGLPETAAPVELETGAGKK